MNPSGDFLSGARIVLVEDDGDIARLNQQRVNVHDEEESARA